jgi:hypothetical protein
MHAAALPLPPRSGFLAIDRARAMMTDMMRNGLAEGFILDRQWFWLRGEMERTKGDGRVERCINSGQSTSSWLTSSSII